MAERYHAGFRRGRSQSTIAQSSSVEAYMLSRVFSEPSKTLEGLQRGPEERVYSMLGAVCSLHFRPENGDDPFGAMARFSDRRTAVPRGRPSHLSG